MKKRSILLIVLSITIVCMGFGAAYMLSRKADLNDVKVVQSKISRHILLPSDEAPALITVVDKSKVTAKFLDAAKTDDKVLVYDKHERAIIYRPSIDKVVDIKEFSLGNASSEAPKAAWPKNLP